MTNYILSFKPNVKGFGYHDPSAALFSGTDLLYAAEEERFSRNKHAPGEFPENAIDACLKHAGIDFSDLDQIVLPYKPQLATKNTRYELSFSRQRSDSLFFQIARWGLNVHDLISKTRSPLSPVKKELQNRYDTVPPLKLAEHHRCHAISAFHYSDFEEGLVLTIDGHGEYDSTVIWHATQSGLDRVRTYKVQNSIGRFYGAVTEFLGFRRFNGEGKVMGLAPYGSQNEDIESALFSIIDDGVEYDVSKITKYRAPERITVLEELFGRSRNEGDTTSFTDWEKDLAYTTQKITENIASDIVEYYLDELGTANLSVAGGVALNCKMNKRLMELPAVEEIFIQPVAHDAGLALGGGLIDTDPSDVTEMTHSYTGSEFSNEEIKTVLEKNKILYKEPDNIAKAVAKALADGKLVARFAGRMELGPRALGNRSILADPRTISSRDRVNKFVKHREEWRPFAPSMLVEAAEDYLLNAEPSPFMIKTFDVNPEKRDEIEAVLHPGDDTTRPQTVSEDQNPEYHAIISEFERLTGVPVILNTSLNDHGEPIVRTPTEAIKDFYGMGLDMLVLNDFLIRKPVTDVPE